MVSRIDPLSYDPASEYPSAVISNKAAPTIDNQLSRNRANQITSFQTMIRDAQVKVNERLNTHRGEIDSESFANYPHATLLMGEAKQQDVHLLINKIEQLSHKNNLKIDYDNMVLNGQSTAIQQHFGEKSKEPPIEIEVAKHFKLEDRKELVKKRVEEIKKGLKDEKRSDKAELPDIGEVVELPKTLTPEEEKEEEITYFKNIKMKYEKMTATDLKKVLDRKNLNYRARDKKPELLKRLMNDEIERYSVSLSPPPSSLIPSIERKTISPSPTKGKGLDLIRKNGKIDLNDIENTFRYGHKPISGKGVFMKKDEVKSIQQAEKKAGLIAISSRHIIR